jgi:hypothetical protein
MGKIGIAISPQNPDNIYAAIELDRRTGGVYMSRDRGASWTKQSSAVAGATGPHYYQELYASPHQEGRLYLINNNMLLSEDHGKTFNNMKREGMHSDSHSINFRADDPNYLLVGTDGGIYESFDLAENWRFIDNLPITQYYKVAVDDTEPFYWVYGGTQDNGSHGGPSRTDTEHGIRNADWIKTLFADGHQSATEPGNPNIMYAETQQGGLHRIDRITGEQVLVQPQPGEGEDYERFNWDAPIVVSPHNPARLYFASQRVWKSENRGDSWEVISGDLTRDQERFDLPIMGKTQSWENPWDVLAMSNYNTITSISESPVQEGLLYVGTDDGIIQISEDGQNWRKVEVGTIKSVPSTAFVNDIRADLHDANIVYACLDNHKYGDYKPYVIKSVDKGASWTLINGDLPNQLLVWRMVQDHVKKELLFIGTEYGIYFSVNGGNNWIKLKGGMPTIPIRDLTIQRRENDLVAASFGRGFFILDDISPLRETTENTLAQEALLFPVKKAYWYVERSVVSSQGASHYTAPNPDFGAIFTYYLKDDLTTIKQDRIKNEKEAVKSNQAVRFPGWETLEDERKQSDPKIIFTIKDNEGNLVNTVEGSTKKGIHRVNWDLRYASKNVVRMDERPGGWASRGFPVTPGNFTVTMHKVVDGTMSQLSEPVEFEVVPLREGALEPRSYDEMESFRDKLISLQQGITSTSTVLSNSMSQRDAMMTALNRSNQYSDDLVKRLEALRLSLVNLDVKLNGNPTKDEVGEKYPPTPRSRMSIGYRAMRTTYGPTPLHEQMVELGMRELEGIRVELKKIVDEVIPQLETDLQAIGAPWIEGQDY